MSPQPWTPPEADKPRWKPPASDVQGTADRTVRDHLKDEGFLDSVWNVVKSPASIVKSLISGDYAKEGTEQYRRAQVLRESGTPEQRREFAKEVILKNIPGASTAYKATHGNIAGATGDVAGMVALGGIAKGVEKTVDAASTIKSVVTDPAVTSAARAALPVKARAVLNAAEAVKNRINAERMGPAEQPAGGFFPSDYPSPTSAPPPVAPRVSMAEQQGVTLAPHPRHVAEFSAMPATQFPQRAIRPGLPVERPVAPETTPAPATAIPETVVDNRTMPQIAADEFAANRPPAEPPKVDPYDVAVGMGAKMSRKQYEGLPTDHPVRVNAEKTAAALDANAAKPPVETAPTVEEKSPPLAPEGAPIADLPSMSKAKTPSDLAKAAGFPDGYVPTGKELAQAIHDSMAERGALPPENGATPSGAPDPTALADLMREVPNATRKPIADANYRAIKEGAAESNTAAPVYESSNRAIKVSPVAKALMDHGITYSDLTSLSAKQIQAYVDQLSAATAAEGGAHPGHMFSKLSIEELMGEMRRAEKASK